jgi:hypothetical protein
VVDERRQKEENLNWMWLAYAGAWHRLLGAAGLENSPEARIIACTQGRQSCKFVFGCPGLDWGRQDLDQTAARTLLQGPVGKGACDVTGARMWYLS